MRKLILLTVTLFLLTFTASAYAQQEKIDVYQQKKLVKSVVFQVGLKEYFVNNQIPGVKMDVAPFIENGRTFVPVRFLSNALGVRNGNIFWFGDTGQVKLQEPGFNVVELTVGKVEVLSNGEPVSNVDVAPLLRDSRTFLPARFVANALGYDVEWNPELNLVVCWPKGEEKPDISAIVKYIQEQKKEQPPVQDKDRWVITDGVYLPNPDNPDVLSKKFSDTYYTTKNGLFIRTPAELGGDNCQIYVDYREALEQSKRTGAYDELYQILYGTFKDERLAKEITDYVRNNKVKWQVEILEKKWTASDGRQIEVYDGGDIAVVDILLK